MRAMKIFPRWNPLGEKRFQIAEMETKASGDFFFVDFSITFLCIENRERLTHELTFNKMTDIKLALNLPFIMIVNTIEWLSRRKNIQCIPLLTNDSD